jgi:ATPase family associated with various cellular activities (AAA)
MPEAVLVPATFGAPPLAARTAALAGRVADLVGSLGADPALEFVERFLRAMAADAPSSSSSAGPDALDGLASLLGLAPVEIDLIAVAGLADDHEGYASALRRINPTGTPFATVGLAAQLLCAGPGERARLRELLDRGAAVTSGSLAVESGGPFFERTIRVGDRLWSALQGIDVWPEGVTRADVEPVRAGLEEWLAAQPARRAAKALSAGAAVTVLVTGDSAQVAVGRAVVLAAASGVEPAVLEAEAWTPELVRLVRVHALLRGCVPVLAVGPAEPPAQPFVPDAESHPGPFVLCARTGGAAPRGRRPVLAVPAERLSVGALRRVWSSALPELGDDAPLLAARHALEPSAAAEIAADVRTRRSLDGGAASAGDVTASIRVRAGLSLTAGVKLVHPAAGWSQLVLPPDRLAQLREALDRLRHQVVVLDDWGFLAGRPGARGVRMLFAGPPGTGKTLSAEVLAGELGVDLLVVDIARVVSKWIGETEKNLAEVFDVAERAQCVLFFDEADALFGRRTEVSDAHDRYANLETAYLLARLERFEGLAVLATNLRQNIDPAFMRRLEFAVDFDEPAAGEREQLWRCHLPERAPLADDVHPAHLAGLYAVVGGVIRNAATAAAFRAAAEGEPIGRRHVVAALRREYEKAGRAFPGAPDESTIAGRSHA